VNIYNIKNLLIKRIYVINIGVGVYFIRFIEIVYLQAEPGELHVKVGST